METGTSTVPPAWPTTLPMVTVGSTVLKDAGPATGTSGICVTGRSTDFWATREAARRELGPETVTSSVPGPVLLKVTDQPAGIPLASSTLVTCSRDGL